MDDSENHEYIYLQPPCCADPYDGRMWSRDKCPCDECEEGNDWTQYVHEDKFEALKAENAKLQGWIEELKLVGRWIPTTEKFPDIYELVLVTTVDDTGRHVTIMRFEGENKWWCEGCAYPGRLVFSWMPLPLPDGE